jgi:IS5 family transposase
LGNPLKKLSKSVDFELFRDILETNLNKSSKGKGGPRPYDYVLMFKILILQRYYNLSDDQIEYQIKDRMSFMRFLNLTIADEIPDSKTVWNFKDQIIDLEIFESIFILFLNKLKVLGLVVNDGKIIDASFIEVPIQRNSKENNDIIKAGRGEELWIDNPNKKAQKDINARWTMKNNISYYGYKNHTKVDQGSKIITGFMVTDASVHDSQVMDYLLDETDKGEVFYADSAYRGEKQEMIIAQKEMINKVCEKAYKGKPLTEEQKGNKH